MRVNGRWTPAPASEEDVCRDEAAAAGGEVEADEEVGIAVAVHVAGHEPGALRLEQAELAGGGGAESGEGIGADEAESLVAGREAVGVDAGEVELVGTGEEILNHVEGDRG